MSTRSVIAIPQGDSWKGRYCHSDGYPSGQLAEIRSLIQRDGVPRVIEVLTQEHFGWSYLLSEGVSRNSLGDDRAVVVPGYGLAYVNGTEQPDSWITENGNDWGAEWAYVIAAHGVLVFKRAYSDDLAGGWEYLQTVDHDAESIPDWLLDA